jgi:peptidyl-dipeptidase A
MVRQAERFYVSIGFDALPETFWERSSLFPLPAGSDHKKNNHASAWHIDLERDVRCLMSIVPNTDFYDTTHHELGHIYYDLTYSRPEVPYLLRGGANRGYHEAIGSLMGFAALQPRFVAAVGLGAGGDPPDPTQLLLRSALANVVFIPFSTGTMANFERDLYVEELSPERWNARWWELAARYQGIAPPTARGEEWCDACTKTHINDDPAGYYDYAVSYALLFQLHAAIARDILKEDPHDTNYFGRKEVGDFLRSIMAPGQSVDWRALLREKTGSDLSGEAMVAYFQPLMEWLVAQNRGRKHTLPDL